MPVLMRVQPVFLIVACAVPLILAIGGYSLSDGVDRVATAQTLAQAVAAIDARIGHEPAPEQLFWATLALATMFAAVLLSAYIRRMQRSQQRLLQDNRNLVEAERLAHVGSFSWDTQTGEIIWSDGLCALLGYERDEAIERHKLEDVVPYPADHDFAAAWSVDRPAIDHQPFAPAVYPVARKDGSLVHIKTQGRLELSPAGTLRFVGVSQDVSASVLAEQQIADARSELQQLTDYDALTKLPNRRLLGDRLDQAMAHAARNEKILGIAFIDLDCFKAINDSLGRELADQLLIDIAQRMQKALRHGDTLARCGGDEFVALLTDLDAPEESSIILSRLRQAVRRDLVLADGTMRTSASIGVTFYPQAELLAPDQLLRQADQAMCQAKLIGKNGCHWFDPSLDLSIKQRYENLEAIRTGLRKDQFRLHFQPIVDSRTGLPVAAEALLRWHFPQQGVRLPDTFLPAIGQSDLAIELGEWVIAEALRFAAILQRRGHAIVLGVNIDGHHLLQDDFVDRVAALFAGYPAVAGHWLEFEVLETNAIGDMVTAIRNIEGCRKLGIRFAIDDFGTGYSSLAYLKRLPVDTVKIDQGFVRGMTHDAEDREIVKGVLGLAQAFDLEVTAEGVESRAHIALLRATDCHRMQGNAIAPPMPAEALQRWLGEWSPESIAPPSPVVVAPLRRSNRH